MDAGMIANQSNSKIKSLQQAIDVSFSYMLPAFIYIKLLFEFIFRTN
jgi:hypothetical protein